MKPVGSPLCVAVFAALIGSSDAITATEARYKPVVVFSLASYERLVRDVQSVVDPRLTALAADLLGRSLAVPVSPVTLSPVGLDTRRSWGLVVETDGQSFPTYGFIPATDLARLVAGPVALGKLKPPVDGVYEVRVADRTWYAAQKGAWTNFASTPHGLDTVPDDPLKLLGGMHASHDIAARVLLENLPTEVRQTASRWLKEGHSLQLVRSPGESSFEAAVRTALVNQGFHLAASLAEEGESLAAGLSLDPRARAAVFELEVTARPGTATAEGLQAPSRTKSDFSGFLVPGAALTGVWTGEIARMPLYRVLMLLDSVGSQMMGGSRDAAGLWRTIREGLIEDDVDGGLAMIVRSDGLTMALGGHIADGGKMESQFRQLASAASSAIADVPRWKLDAGRYQNVRFHAISVPIPRDAPDRRGLVRIFGPTLEVVVGVGQRSLYVAAGKYPADLLKQVIRGPQSKPRKQSPVQFTLALGSLAKFVAETGDSGTQAPAARIAAMLEQSAGKDRILLTAWPIARGTHVRLEAEEGVLRAVTSLATPPRVLPPLRPR